MHTAYTYVPPLPLLVVDPYDPENAAALSLRVALELLGVRARSFKWWFAMATGCLLRILSILSLFTLPLALFAAIVFFGAAGAVVPFLFLGFSFFAYEAFWCDIKDRLAHSAVGVIEATYAGAAISTTAISRLSA